MKVTNVESCFFSYERVDDIIIPLTVGLMTNKKYGPTKEYYGQCGNGRLRVKVRITSGCPPNKYGEVCEILCKEVPEENACNYLGESISLGPKKII